MSEITATVNGRWVWTARAVVLLGVGLLSFGAWQAWPPAGPIVLGAILLTFGVGALRA